MDHHLIFLRIKAGCKHFVMKRLVVPCGPGCPEDTSITRVSIKNVTGREFDTAERPFSLKGRTHAC